MDKKTTGIVAYITLIGWLIAYFAGDRENAKFHLNQSLVITIIGLAISILSGILGGITLIRILLSLLNLALFVLWVIAFIRACKDNETPIPLIGGIKILK